MKVSLLLSFLFIGWSCSKTNIDSLANALVGTWRLASYCKPTSTSACASVTVPTGKDVLISFTSDGKFNETYANTNPGEYSFLGCGSGRYQLEKNGIRITAACMSSLSGRLIPLVSQRDDRLTVNPYGTGEFLFVRTP